MGGSEAPRRRGRAGGDERLIAAAREARDRAVADYSGFKVGAALETADGAIVTGCNIENASYGLTMCAERVALFKALSEGHRAFTRLAIVTGAGEPTAPCGACRQLIWEFAGDIEVTAVARGGRTARWQAAAMLPAPFDARSIAATSGTARGARAGGPSRRARPGRAKRPR